LYREQVSIHAPARGATDDPSEAARLCKFQSTRPRGARPPDPDRSPGLHPVSIHAPARGATDLKVVERAENALFQSTRPRGARRMKSPIRTCPSGFNPRARAGRDFPSTTILLTRLSFNPRARAGRDRGIITVWHEAQGVSIHAPARGATPGRRAGCSGPSGFNPRARAGRDSGSSTRFRSPSSFNPRARAGRDLRACTMISRSDVSIHAPARGATPRDFSTPDTYTSFNPRARAGRDHGPHDEEHHQNDVSIHAPARGATAWPTIDSLFFSCFNPRARAGRDPMRRKSSSTARRFNPRARAGRDRRGEPMLLHLVQFQSTRPRGARPSCPIAGDPPFAVSIHAPARGATTARRRILRRSWFQSTRPRGARPAGSGRQKGERQFQSTRPRGARQTFRGDLGLGFQFQSTRPRGARPRVPSDQRVLRVVSIHAPARGATAEGDPVGTHFKCFNPRARAGRDKITAANPSAFSLFQSTRPRGARPSYRLLRDLAVEFQSTRPRGARPSRMNGRTWIRSFQSTRPRGARPPHRPCDCANGEVSIHAPARGATLSIGRIPPPCRKFQSTRPRGARPQPAGQLDQGFRVSIHAPARGATPAP